MKAPPPSANPDDSRVVGMKKYLKNLDKTESTESCFHSLNSSLSVILQLNGLFSRTASHIFVMATRMSPPQNDSSGLKPDRLFTAPVFCLFIRHQTSEGVLWYLPQDVGIRSFNPVYEEMTREVNNHLYVVQDLRRIRKTHPKVTFWGRPSLQQASRVAGNQTIFFKLLSVSCRFLTHFC